MKRLAKILIIPIVISVLSGCSTVVVDVNGYLDHEYASVLAPGNSFFVVENSDADNPLLEKEIASKIECYANSA